MLFWGKIAEYVGVIVGVMVLISPGLVIAGEQRPVFSASAPGDLQEQLIADCTALGLDMTEAAFSTRPGFVTLRSPGFEIRRANESGHLNFLGKDVVLGEVERSAEPYDKAFFENAATVLLENLGVQTEDIAEVAVRRVLSRTESADSDVADVVRTGGFIVAVRREIAGLPVFGGGAQLLFAVDGRLKNVSVNWRERGATATRQATMRDESGLFTEAKAAAEARHKGRIEPDAQGMIAYREMGAHEGQRDFSPIYVLQYKTSPESGIEFIFVDATEAETPAR